MAGWADGTVSGNYYLQEKAVGIDGIDYAGQTAPLSFGAFSALEGIPADFLTFRLANMLAFDKINLPQWDLFFIGAAISALGLLIGRLLGRRRSKPA